MKFIVDQLPKTRGACPFSKLRELHGDMIYNAEVYVCKIDNKWCNLDIEERPITCVSCRWLKI